MHATSATAVNAARCRTKPPCVIELPVATLHKPVRGIALNGLCRIRRIDVHLPVVFCDISLIPIQNPFIDVSGRVVKSPVVRLIASYDCRAAIRRAGDCSLAEIAEIIKKTAFKITRVGQLVAREASNRLGVPFGIVDLSLAPTPAIGDSVAYILESMGLEQCGACGTTAALALLNDAVKKGGVMASSQVGGLSGAFIPVSEDAGMIRAATDGALSLEKLEAMTCVCSVGLDMIAMAW